jgi:hypothetical protein
MPDFQVSNIVQLEEVGRAGDEVPSSRLCSQSEACTFDLSYFEMSLFGIARKF